MLSVMVGIYLCTLRRAHRSPAFMNIMSVDVPLNLEQIGSFANPSSFTLFCVAATYACRYFLLAWYVQTVFRRFIMYCRWWVWLNLFLPDPDKFVELKSDKCKSRRELLSVDVDRVDFDDYNSPYVSDCLTNGIKQKKLSQWCRLKERWKFAGYGIYNWVTINFLWHVCL